MELIIQRAKEFVRNKFITDQNVVAILLVGSAARGTADELSDIDFYILLDQEIGRTSEILVFDGRKIELLYNTIVGAKGYLYRENCALYRNVSSMLENSKFVYGNREIANELLAYATNNTSSVLNLAKETIDQYLSSATDFLDEMKRYSNSNDRVAYMLSQKQFLDAIMPLIVFTSGTYMQKPNLLSNWLKKNDPSIYGLLEKLAENADFGSARSLFDSINSKIK